MLDYEDDEEEVPQSYFHHTVNIFDNLETVNPFSGKLEPEYFLEMAETLNRKAKAITQAHLFLEQECKEAAEVCIATAQLLNDINNGNNN